jgi:uncharacterized repeat protein (TIGR02543 family)
MKINDGSSWKEAKSLKIHNGATWLSAKKAYVYDNGWKIAYPNLPQSSGLTMLYSGTTYPSIPTTWSIMGNWNADPAYAPASFTYQWKRGGIDISGATSSTYTTTASDVDSTIGVTVVATNERGNTTVSQSTGSVTLPTISSMSAYDSTATPSQPSVSVSSNYLNYSGSWTSSSNATTYSVSTNNGSVSPSGQTFSGSGSAGSVTVSVTPINTNKTVYIYWAAAAGASSYDIVKYGNGVTTTVNVPSSTTSYTWSIADGNEGNQFTVYPKSPSGGQGYGMSQSVTVSNKTGTAGSASASLTAVPVVAVPSGGSASLSPSGTVQARTTINASTSFSTGSPTAYEIQIRKATGSSPADENSGTQVALSSSSATSHVITDSEASGTPDQFAAFGRAYNAGGWSSWVKSNTVTSTPYVPPVTTYTISYNANGGSGGGDVSFTTGTSIAPGAPSRSGYTFNGWYDTGYLDYTYYVGAGGTWTPPARNITMYARWTAVVSGSAPTLSVSNTYDGSIGGKYQWTLTITNTSSTAATSYAWGVQFSNSSGGTVNASTSGTGGSIPAGGSVTVTRNDATNSWARWVNITASNAYGTSSTATTGWA